MLAVLEEIVGPEHPDVATALGNIAMDLNRMGRYSEAEAFLRRSLAINEKIHGPDHRSLGWSLWFAFVLRKLSQ